MSISLNLKFLEHNDNEKKKQGEKKFIYSNSTLFSSEYKQISPLKTTIVILLTSLELATCETRISQGKRI